MQVHALTIRQLQLIPAHQISPHRPGRIVIFCDIKCRIWRELRFRTWKLSMSQIYTMLQPHMNLD